jgi:hypothetical protein
MHISDFAADELAYVSPRRVAHSAIMAVIVVLLRIVRKIDFALRDFE